MAIIVMIMMLTRYKYLYNPTWSSLQLVPKNEARCNKDKLYDNLLESEPGG